MKKSVFLLALLLVWATSVGLAADFVWFRTYTNAWKKSEHPHFLEGQISATVLNSLDSIYKKTPLSYTFYEKGGKRYVQVNCTFDLYETQGDKLINQYQYSNKGYNCASHSFERAGAHYMLGGHGFWRNHLDLLYFDELHGSWELVVTKNQPEDLFTSFVYQNGEGLVALFGEKSNPRSGLNEKNVQGHFLDWKTKEWKEIEFHIEGVDSKELVEKSGLYFIQTQDYAFWAATSGLKNIGWNLIDKKSGKIFYFESKNVDMGLADYLEIVGNVLTYPAPSGELKTLDLDQIRQKSKEVGYIRVKEAAAFGIPSTWVYALFFVLVAIGWLVVKKGLPKKRVDVAEVESTLEQDPMQVLLACSGQLLSTETLDQLLGIADLLNFDSRRMKRARLINEINLQYLAQQGKELIVREKKSEDKRYVYYKIQA